MELQEKREAVVSILSRIQPFLQRDGGDVEFVSLTEDQVVQVKLKGMCHGCPNASLTMKKVIEAGIIKNVPGIKAVVAVD